MDVVSVTSECAHLKELLISNMADPGVKQPIIERLLQVVSVLRTLSMTTIKGDGVHVTT